MKAWFHLSLLLVLFLVSCTPAASTPVAAPGPSLKSNSAAKYTPKYEAVDECPFEPQLMPGIDYECGYLVVPEDRNQLDTPEIKIAVVTYYSTGEKALPDPLLILVTNPSGELSFSSAFPYGFEEILKERDLILVDTRGTGFSEPSLSCPALRDIYYQTLDQDPNSQDLQDRYTEALLACRQEWNTKSQNLAAYSTAQAAADLDDLRDALGIQQWNVFGVGYGSTLAYALLRDYPATVRSVVLDGIEPMDGDTYSGMALHTQKILDQYMDLCAADEKCNQAYPNLKEVFYEIVAQLDSHPLTLEMDDKQNGGRHNVYINGDRLRGMVIYSIAYNMPDLLAELPRILFQFKKGEYTRFNEMMGRFISFNEPGEMGMQSRMSCVERLQFIPLEKIQSSNSGADAGIVENLVEQAELNRASCERLWGDLYGSEKGLTVFQPGGRVPALVLNADQNAFTPAAWVKQVSEQLGATSIEMAGSGMLDWVFGSQSGCVRPVVKAFLDDPSTQPNAACAAERKPMLWITLQ